MDFVSCLTFEHTLIQQKVRSAVLLSLSMGMVHSMSAELTGLSRRQNCLNAGFLMRLSPLWAHKVVEVEERKELGTARRVREERGRKSEEMEELRREAKEERSGKGERRVEMLRAWMEEDEERRRRK
ncbi:hypothetical protein ACFXTO_025123 [Malus domestica]